jgi:uncharacterized membrane protein
MTRRLGAAALVAVLVLGAVAAAPALAAASAAAPESVGERAPNAGLASQTAPGPVPQATPDGFDSTVFRVTAYENGSARWTLQYLRLLENESQVATFEEYAAEFERTEPAFVRDFRTRAERLTAFGTNATGRNMTATGFRRAAFVRTQPGGTQAVGVVELSFLWGGFAQVREDRVVVSDVFEGGMYVDTDQRLVFAHGRNLSFAADGVDPEPDSVAGGTLGASDTVTWVGERRFLDARPRVAYARVGAGAEPPGGEATTTDPDGVDGGAGPDNGGDPDGSSPNDGGSGLMLPVALGVVLLLGLVGLAWYSGAIPAGRTSGTDGETGSPGDAGGTSAGTARGQTRDPAASPPVSEAELLSDEDRVRRLLEDNGGRMKQVDIVDETEWSKSKVSMLLSEMEEDGEISKLRVGRENIISLSGHEPDAAGSPFDEE